MSGFESSNTTDKPQTAPGVDAFGTQLSREEIERHIARGHWLRAQELQQWGQRVARTWGSLFRRPGRLIPKSARAGEPLPATQQS